MEIAIVLILFALLAYLLYDELNEGSTVPKTSRKRLCDYYVAGSVFEDIPTVLKRGTRLLELHVYSDEQDHPVVAKYHLNSGYNYAEDNLSFDECCVDIVNDAFPSKDPMILSLVVHTDKSIVMDRIAETLQTTVRKHMIPDKDIQTRPLESFANKLIIVSGGAIQGTALEPLVNLSWSDSGVRRLTLQQALHPRDEPELMEFNRDRITVVAPEPELETIRANPDRPKAMGCQWNVYSKGPGGFVEKPSSLQ